MARDNPVSGFSSITPHGLPRAPSKHRLINGQNVRRYPHIYGETQGQHQYSPLFVRDPSTRQFVNAGKKVHEAVAVLRTYLAADVKIEAPVSPDSKTSASVQERKPSEVSNVNDRHPKIERGECREADAIDDIEDQKHEENGDEDDASQDVSDVEGECLVEHRRHPVRADQIEHFIKVVFRFGIQQKGCKKVLQYWVKKCHPKKQASHPYNGGQKPRWTDEENKGEFTAPPYWPSQKDWRNAEKSNSCRHKEPDHLKKPERLVLCRHLLTRGKLEEFDFSVHLLEESTKDLTDTYADHFLPEAAEHLADIYELRRHQIRFENGEIDADSTILILMPRKAKFHDIKVTAKLRQQLPKKARPTFLASELDTASHGYGPNPRQIKMKAETIISRSSSLHDALSTTEQSDDDDEDMTTEPCSSPTSPMALDAQIGAGNANSFGHDSYTSSCRSESHDMSTEFQPVIKAEEQRFGQNPRSYGDAEMQKEMSLTSSSPYDIAQQALGNQQFEPGSFDLGANDVFSAMPGSQNAGVSPGVPGLGSPRYGENQMLNTWPLQTNEFSNGVSPNAFANSDGSHTCPYDSNQFNQGSSEHLRGEPSWYLTNFDRPDYSSSMSHSGYNDMNGTQIFCPDQIHHGNRSTAAERRESYTTGDWPSSAQV
ncbi:MAG: hypothetical protein OHK93_002881 [Ramalina farinacea]|uniref:Subtelomeric hrmA-associated cluster protein AFUB-079030/YDR124W-like helical bundle domain-containing protein n=1 Tax=Ramalina farinacea TaxID=258253 RepID=A0AA43U0S2_9LECA|nr:hypothetical protein [Ramalina farinacea]